jgi:hypothetical protein
MKFSADTLSGSRQKKIDRSIGRCMWRVAFVLELARICTGMEIRPGAAYHPTTVADRGSLCRLCIVRLRRAEVRYTDAMHHISCCLRVSQSRVNHMNEIQWYC